MKFTTIHGRLTEASDRLEKCLHRKYQWRKFVFKPCFDLGGAVANWFWAQQLREKVINEKQEISSTYTPPCS